jgi:DNA-directed RNA polymerase beta' subunit
MLIGSLRTRGRPATAGIPAAAGVAAAAGPPQPLFRAFQELPEKEVDAQYLRLRQRKQIEQIPEAIITNTELAVYSWEEIEKISVMEIKNSETEGKDSLNDSRLGAVGARCSTCIKQNCEGHYGRYKFKERIYNPKLIGYVAKILTIICPGCGRLKFDREYLEQKGLLRISPLQRIDILADKHANSAICSRATRPEAGQGPIARCSIINEFYKAPKQSSFIHRYRGKKVGSDFVNLFAEDAYKMLADIPREDLNLLGFLADVHPKDFILTGILVIPPTARPPRYQDGKAIQNRITEMYIKIFTANNALGHANSVLDKEQKLQALQNSYAELIDTKISNGPVGGPRGKDYKSIFEQINGKKGLMRYGVMGRRANYCARTVIGPDPTLKFGEISIPQVWAPILTVRETVQSYNIGRLTNLLRLETPHIVTIIPGSGRRAGSELKVGHHNAPKVLHIGDQVERWLQDGDYVMFNRQPTLHKQSQMVGRVVLRSALKIGLHLAYSTPQGADFDGDEENINALRTWGATAEGITLMNATNCIMSAQQNKPIMGLVMDSLIGAYRLSDPTLRVREEDISDLLMNITNSQDLSSLNERLALFNINPLSGRALISALFPANFSYTKGDVLIRKGVLVKGLLGKEHLLTTHRSIIQELYHDPEFGPDRTADFITDATFLFDKAATLYNNSVGLDDCLIGNPEIADLLSREFEQIRSEVADLENIVTTSASEATFKERRIRNAVDQIKSIGRTVVEKVAVIPTRLVKEFNLTVRAAGSNFDGHDLPPITNINDYKAVLGSLSFSDEKMAKALERLLQQPYTEETKQIAQAMTLHSRLDRITFQDPRVDATLADTKYLDNADATSVTVLKNRQSNLAAWVRARDMVINKLWAIIYSMDLTAAGPTSGSGGSVTTVLNDIHKQILRMEAANSIYGWVVDLDGTRANSGFTSQRVGIAKYIRGELIRRELRQLIDQLATVDTNTTYDRMRELYKQLIAFAPALEDGAPPGLNAFTVATDVGSGAKASLANFAQVSTAVGQIFYKSERIAPQLANYTKCLSTYDADDPSISSRGFCESSYGVGLTPEETWNNFVAGRDALLDTALRTSVTGELQRELAKVIGENVVAAFDGSMRSPATGPIVTKQPLNAGRDLLYQTVYGTDGFDAKELMKVSVPGFDELAFFADPAAIADKINAKFGWVPKAAVRPVTTKAPQSRIEVIAGAPPVYDTTDLLPQRSPYGLTGGAPAITLESLGIVPVVGKPVATVTIDLTKQGEEVSFD